MTRRSALLSLALLLGGAQAAEPVTLYTEDYPPFSWVDKGSGKVVGLAADIVADLMQRAGVPTSQPVVAPWARAMVLTMTTPNSCLYTTARVPEREDNYQWIGPIGHNEWVLFALRDEHIRLDSLDAAANYQIGTFIGDASIAFLREHKLRVETVPNDRLNPPKLQKRRIKLWSVGRLPGMFLQRELGIDDFEPVLAFARADMYLACHKNMAKAEVARLNDILQTMYRDGTIRRIYTQYGYEKEMPR